MGYHGKIKEQEQVIKLRKRGLSYNQIKSIVPVSKNSISRWCQTISLTQKQRDRLFNNRILGGMKGRYLGSATNKKLRIEDINRQGQLGKNMVLPLTSRDCFMAGIGIYIGDGYKNDRCFGFSNSDPKTILFMSNWLNKYFFIPNNRMYGQIWLYKDLNEHMARVFWSRYLNLPIKNIYKSYISKKTTRKRGTDHKYGIFKLIVSSAQLQRKILGCMSGVLN